jgi:hypothetical protein
MPPPGHRRAGQDRTTQGRVRMTLGLRAANHAQMALRAVAGGRSRGWLAAAAGSLAVDAVLARRLEDPAYLPGWGHWAAGWIDSVVWAHATDDRTDLISYQACEAIPQAIVATVDAFAGTEALPVYNPGRPYPAAGWTDVADRMARMAATALAPTAIAAVVRRRRGLSLGLRNVVWPLECMPVTAFYCCHRDRLQRSERQRWARRTEAQVRQEFDNARLGMALASSPGHDFKKTLFALGIYGSPEAGDEARRQGVRPAELAGGLDGMTLFELTRSTRIRPRSAATLWLTPREADEIGAFLRAAEARAADGADQAIRVAYEPGRRLVIDHLGDRLVVRKDPPPLRARLYPSSVALLTAAFLSAGPAIMGDLPVTAVAPSVGLLAWEARRFWDRAPDDAELRRLVLVATGAAALGFVGAATRLRPGRFTPAEPAAAPAAAGGGRRMGGGHASGGAPLGHRDGHRRRRHRPGRGVVVAAHRPGRRRGPELRRRPPGGADGGLPGGGPPGRRRRARPPRAPAGHRPPGPRRPAPAARPGAGGPPRRRLRGPRGLAHPPPGRRPAPARRVRPSVAWSAPNDRCPDGSRAVREMTVTDR